MDAALQLRAGDSVLSIAGTAVMGVVNASPDSFSDAGRYATTADQIAHAARLADAGADIVDVGGESAITGRPELDAEQEIARVLPIVEWLRDNRPNTLISVDTYKPAVARAAVRAGAAVVNDVSGLRDDELAEICASSGAALVIMHTSTAPKVARQDPDAYTDVVAEVTGFLHRTMLRAESLGVPRESIVLDPGPDFTKTPHQTVEVLRNLQPLRDLGRPLLLALSRKDFLGAITGRAPRGRDAATVAAVAHVARTPGSIVRVHDVAAAVDAVRTIDVLLGRREIPADFRLPDDIRHEPPPSAPR